MGVGRICKRWWWRDNVEDPVYISSKAICYMSVKQPACDSCSGAEASDLIAGPSFQNVGLRLHFPHDIRAAELSTDDTKTIQIACCIVTFSDY